MKTTSNIPTAISTDAAELHSRMADRGYAARMVWVTVDEAPLWHDGDIVGRVSGEFPAAYMSADSEYAVVLYDNGDLSALTMWTVVSERE